MSNTGDCRTAPATPGLLITSGDIKMGLTANCVIMCESMNRPNTRSVEKGL